LAAAAIKAWRYRSWIFLRNPHFVQKAARVLSACAFDGVSLVPND
jgi:hypothetical protein